MSASYTSAIIDDPLGWVIIAVTFGLAKNGSVDLYTVAKSVIGTVSFMTFSFTIGRRIVFEIICWTNATQGGSLAIDCLLEHAQAVLPSRRSVHMNTLSSGARNTARRKSFARTVKSPIHGALERPRLPKVRASNCDLGWLKAWASNTSIPGRHIR